MGARQ